MPWALLLDWRVWAAGAFAALGIYAAVQHIGWESAKARYVTLEAETAKLAAEAKVKNAQEATRMANNATEALSDLQVRNQAIEARHSALRARYDRLRADSSSGGLPQAGGTSTSIIPGPADPQQSDADARCMAKVESALKWGDLELAKFRDLWLLDQANAKP